MIGFQAGLVSCWYHSAIHCTAEKIKSYTGHRDSHGDISNHRTEVGNKSQLDSFVDTGYFSLLPQDQKVPIYKTDSMLKN